MSKMTLIKLRRFADWSASLLFAYIQRLVLSDEKVRAGCFAFIFVHMSCYCKCFVALPHSDVGCSEVYDCGIS